MQYTGYSGGAGDSPVTFGPSGTESGMQYTGTGNDATMFNAAPQGPVHNIPNPHLTPFIVGGAALAAGAGAAAGARRKQAETSSSISRTSSSMSDDTFRPLMAYSSPPQNTGYPQKLNSYPAGLAAYVQRRQSLGLTEEQGRNRSGSIGSIATDSSIPATGNSGGVGVGAPGLKPSMAAAMSRAGHQHPQQQQYEPFARMSSPEGIPEDSMVAQYPSQDNTAERSGSSSSRIQTTPGLRLVGSVSSLSLDGKGRPLGPRRKAPVVHSDGGEYREAEPSQRVAPHPPAYAE